MTPDQYARAKELFSAAAQLDCDQWDSFLRQHQDEPAAVLMEVRSLLKHHGEQTLLVRNDDTRPHLSDTQRSASSVTRRSMAGNGLLIKLGPHGYLALGIVLTCLLLVAVNYLTRRGFDATLRELRSSKLVSGLEITVKALQLWIEQEKMTIETVTRDPELRGHTQSLVQLAVDGASGEELRSSSHQADIRRQLEADFGTQVRYAIWDRRFDTIADWSPEGAGLGTGVTPHGAALLSRVFDGQTVIDMPRQNETITKNYRLAPGKPTIGVIAPIRNGQQQVIAALLVYGIGAEDRCNDILRLVQFGRTGEAYAFDKSGLMLSESRFNKQLIAAGLIDASEGVSSLRVSVRDPGGDLTAGYRPSTPVETWPLTTMARFATAGKDGSDLDGYRDYRGVVVVGSWKWLDDYQFGVAVEMDLVELNAALKFLTLQSAFKLALLAAALAGMWWSYYSLARLRRQVGTDSQVGQYTLEEKIGEGGMGVVYKARHALLKRPTAVKLLKAEVTNSRTIGWFEREVQLASQLTHPNTIAIYDYGVTAEGLFYYVMEYLDGVNLLEVVRREGPLDPQRVVHILRQVAGSLNEAHHIGLVHRDIKPHNIMLCQRAFEKDQVKVLDFGLVKEVSDDEHASSTALVGTPLYMAPERITSPGQNDPRIDLYGFGAVGFYLLTGREIFSDNDRRGILHDVINTVPPRVTQCIDTPIPEPLADLIASCLAKDPQNRPPDMDAVLTVLDALQNVSAPIDG